MTSEDAPDYSFANEDAAVEPTPDVAGEDAAVCYVEAVSDADQHGSVTGSYAHSVHARLTAVPAAGYAFTGWYQDDVFLSAEPVIFSDGGFFFRIFFSFLGKNIDKASFYGYTI